MFWGFLSIFAIPWIRSFNEQTNLTCYRTWCEERVAYLEGWCTTSTDLAVIAAESTYQDILETSFIASAALLCDKFIGLCDRCLPESSSSNVEEELSELNQSFYKSLQDKTRKLLYTNEMWTDFREDLDFSFDAFEKIQGVGFSVYREAFRYLTTGDKLYLLIDKLIISIEDVTKSSKFFCSSTIIEEFRNSLEKIKKMAIYESELDGENSLLQQRLNRTEKDVDDIIELNCPDVLLFDEFLINDGNFSSYFTF